MGSFIKPMVVCIILVAGSTVTSLRAQWIPDGLPVCTAVGMQTPGHIISDDDGGAIITWGDNRIGIAHIYAQRIDTSGTILWNPQGVPVCLEPVDMGYSYIVSAGSGSSIITWSNSRSGNGDIYAQRLNASGAMQWTGSGLAVCTAAENQYNPSIAVSGWGAIITWQDYRTSYDSDIYAQHVSLSGSMQWTANGIPVCTATGKQVVPRIVSDAAGGVIIIWMDTRSDTRRDIYAQRLDVWGTALWTTNGVAICTAASLQDIPKITSDGAGGAIITWEDYRSGTSYVYAQRVDSSGTVRWTANGAAICATSGKQLWPQITTDGAGGAIITWYDYRSGDYDIYAFRIDENGLNPVTALPRSLPVSLTLFQNRPNPFNPSTRIRYYLPEQAYMLLEIYGVSGEKIAALADGVREKGYHEAVWEGRDERARPVVSGVYFCRLKAGIETVSRKLVLIR